MARIYYFHKNINGGVFMNMVSESRIPRANIETRAREILHSNGIYMVPVDPLLIAKNEKIAVENATFRDDISGFISREMNKVSIYVNNSDSPSRKLFTIAHELGHYFLHLPQIEGDSDFVEYRKATEYENPEREIEANQFAAALLMPEDEVERLWFSAGATVERLAAACGVSLDAMKFRLINLGYLNVGMI